MKPKTIKGIRQRHGWTQEELAARLGTDAVTVSRWERGISNPRPSAVARLDAMKVPMSDDLSALIDKVGAAVAIKALKRHILLDYRPPARRFAADPARRLKEVERALKEQLKMKNELRISR